MILFPHIHSGKTLFSQNVCVAGTALESKLVSNLPQAAFVPIFDSKQYKLHNDFTENGAVWFMFFYKPKSANGGFGFLLFVIADVFRNLGYTTLKVIPRTRQTRDCGTSPQ